MPLYNASWVETCVVCTPPSEQCYFNECDTCRDGARLPALQMVYDDSVQASINQWQKHENEITKQEQLAKVRVIQPVNHLYKVI
jgi:hypothetical protein